MGGQVSLPTGLCGCGKGVPLLQPQINLLQLADPEEDSMTNLTSVLGLSLAFALTNSPTMARTPEWADDLLFCDLVVRGEVSAIHERDERWRDAMPMLWNSDPDAIVRVAEIQLNNCEVLKGARQDGTVVFVAYVTASIFKDNYAVGQEMVVGLMWSDEVLGGTYWMGSDAGRFVRGSTGWLQQEGGVELQDIAELRAILANASPMRVLSGTDTVVLGTLASEDLSYAVSPSGNEYAMTKMRLVDVQTLSGDELQSEIGVLAIRSGDYWPVWRHDATYPRWLVKGRRYCIAIRRTTDGLVVPRGINGMFEVKGRELYYAGRRATGMQLDDIATDAGGKQ